MKKLSMIIGILSMLVFTGCGGPKTVEVNEKSTDIILKYSKKDAPEGWLWNFGVGKSYSAALADASQALTFESSTVVETKVIVSSKESMSRDQYGNYHRVPAHKIMDTKGKNKYSSENSCELHKLINTSDGMLIIRICKDFNYLEQARINVDYPSHKLQTINLYFHLNEVKGMYSEEDLRTIHLFLKELNSIKINEAWWNFPNNSDKDIENFVLTTYKSWIKSFPMDIYFKEYYGIIFPYDWESDLDTSKKIPAQVWTFKNNPNFKFSFRRKITVPQLQGLTEIDPSYKDYKLVKSSKLNF